MADDVLKWPDSLPLPVRDGYGIKPGDGVIRTDMSSGPARQRKRFSQVPSIISVVFSFTDLEFAIFEAWFKYKANEGASWFAISLLGGLGMQDQDARFNGGWTHKLNGLKHDVTASLEVRERPTLSEGALGIYLSNSIDGLDSAITALSNLVNSTLPSNLG